VHIFHFYVTIVCRIHILIFTHLLKKTRMRHLTALWHITANEVMVLLGGCLRYSLIIHGSLVCLVECEYASNMPCLNAADQSKSIYLGVSVRFIFVIELWGHTCVVGLFLRCISYIMCVSMLFHMSISV
jgi:hypothetical protein